jgi:hypothetical protein
LLKPNSLNFEADYETGHGSFPYFLIRWPEEKAGTVDPVEATLYISIRRPDGCEELEEGQLGIEYTTDGEVRLKAGKPGVSNGMNCHILAALVKN